MMRKGSAFVVAAIAILGLAGCGGDGEPTNAERPETTVTPDVAAETVTRPTATLAPVATATPTGRYTVQSGDTLSALARLFGISVSDIVDANAIEDPNAIAVGLELTIPTPSSSSGG